MSKFLASVLCAVLCGSAVLSIPLKARSPTATTPDAARPSPTVPYASDDPNYPLWNEHTTTIPQPERDQLGSFLELSWGWKEPLTVNGEERTALEDGDEVTLRYSAPGVSGGRITLGEVTGRVLPAR